MVSGQSGSKTPMANCCPSIGALVLKLPPDILPPFVHRVSNIETNNSVDKSIPTTALRTFVTAFPPPLPGLPPPEKSNDAYSAISRVLIPRLLGYIVVPTGIENLPSPPPGMLNIGSESGVSSEAIDVLTDIIRCFGPMLKDAEKQALQKTLLEILHDERTVSVVKKKAVVAISILSLYLPDALLKSFVSQLLSNFQDEDLEAYKRRLLISITGSIARSIPSRLGPYLKNLVPFVLDPLSEDEYEQAMTDMAEDGDVDPEVDEIREAALVALEGLLSCCSNDMRPFTSDALSAILLYLGYEPNAASEEDDEEMAGTQADEDDDEFGGEDEDFEQDNAFSDDEDSSWKIRRCAAKAAYAIISTRSNGDLLDNGTLYDKVAPVLVKRFKEREENVRLEILMALALLVRKTGEAASIGIVHLPDNDIIMDQGPRSRKRRRVDSITDGLGSAGAFSSTLGLNSPAASPSPVSGPRAELAGLSPTIVKGVSQLLKQSSTPTKQTAMSLLRDIVLVQNGGISDSLREILDPLESLIKSSSNLPSGSSSTAVGGAAATSGGAIRIEALHLAGAICDTHSSRILAPYMEGVISSTMVAAKDNYYKVSGEALVTTESIVKAVTPPRSAGTEQQRKAFLTNIYDVVCTKATSSDTDLEVRQKAIHALGVLVARTSGSGSAKLLPATKRTKALDILQDRLKNETTRLSAVKAIEIVLVSAADQNDLQAPWTRTVALELGAQLRKADRSLRSACLSALRSLVFNQTSLSKLDDKTVHELAELLLSIVNARDLNLLGVAMAILSRLVQKNFHEVVNDKLIEAMCGVVQSPLGGRVFDAFLTLVQCIGEQGAGQLLMQAFLQDVGVGGDQAIVGKAIGTLLISGGQSVGVGLKDFEKELRSSKDPKRQCLALSILGEAGYRMGTSSPLNPPTFTKYFSSGTDAVPRAAATALGRAGAGNINVYLPVILSYTGQPGPTQYLSLYSIKEILQNAGTSRSDISPYTRQIWDNLLAASQNEDNKALGAECIGRISSIEPQTFLPLLQVCQVSRSESHI